MSRIADALRLAGDPAPRAHGQAVDVPPAPAAGELPWDLCGETEVTRSAGLHVVARTAAPVLDDRRGQFVELVQRVFRPGTGEPTARLVTIAPLGPAPTCSIALDVGATLASYGAGSVCVVDASFGAAGLHAAAAVSAGPGLCDALLASRSAASLAVQLEPQLWLVPAGDQMCGTPGWLPDALSRSLRQIAARFDFVVVETAPLADSSGMPTLLTVASLTDGTIVVLESAHTRRDVAQDVAARLRASGITVLGAVLAAPSITAAADRGGRELE